ncbi:MAG: hypothetical protein QOH71_1020 [Blastocatellia bacterium]|jgi:hypothetical protein|nr:hypothetical protein [Blastocatellia bacterium]
MLRAVPKSLFSSDYKLLENDATVAVINSSWWREAGELTIKGSTYRVYREGAMGGAFVLESGGAILARAEKPSAFYRSFLIEHDGKKYTLEAESAMFRRFVLSEGGQPRGSVYPESSFTRKAVVAFPEDIPLAVRVFMFWLVMILWKRDSNAAASS